MSRRQEKSLMKLIVSAETDKVIGASMCGPDAPEIMQVSLITLVALNDHKCIKPLNVLLKVRV